MKENFTDVLATHLRAGTSIMAVNTDEESRVVEEIRRAAWKSCDGLKIQIDNAEFNDLRGIFEEFDKTLTKLLDNEEQTVAYDSEAFVKLVKLTGIACQKHPSKKSYSDMQDLLIELLNRGCATIGWDYVSGFPPDGAHSAVLEEALMATVNREKFPENCVFVFKDCHNHLNSTEQSVYRRVVRNLFENNALTSLVAGKEYRRHIIFVQPDWSMHRDLQGCVTMLKFDLPDESHLDAEISIAEASVDDKTKTCPPELRSQLCLALRGFTQMEAANALGFCLAQHQGFAPEMIKTVHRLQKAAFSKNSVLDLVDDDDIASADQVGGFENAIEFAEECKICWTAEARKVGLRRPKGCLLLGIPGTGKTLFGKVIARIMGLPLIIYDVSAQYGSLVGQSEATTKLALAQIKAKGPCVVLIDEADKLFSGIVGGHNGDSGVSQRMLSKLLTFMSTDNEEAFVVLTMNRTLGIPPEMLRAGRLDALFYTTFPAPRERKEILGIHLLKNGVKPDDLAKISKDVDNLVLQTDKYVGSELEQIAIKSVRSAFRRNGHLQPTSDELMEAKKLITPVACLDEDAIKHMDAFCKNTAKPVSKDDVDSKVWSAPKRQIRT
jgi:SpoVK/Ycf46/Vps4 family AAA+-type ATPase